MSCPKPPLWAKKAGKGWRELRVLAADPDPQARAVLAAYLRFRAVGRFPADPLVEWYAAVCRAEADAADRDAAAARDATARDTADLLALVLRKR